MGSLLEIALLLASVYPLAGRVSDAAQTKQGGDSGKWRVLSATGDSIRPQAQRTEDSRDGSTAGSLLEMSNDGAAGTVSRFGYDFAHRKTDHFQLLYRDRSLAGQRVTESCDLLEKAYRAFYADFTVAGFKLQAVSEPLPWIMFDSQQQYRNFARIADGMENPSLESYYSIRRNQVVLLRVTVRRFDNDRHGNDYFAPAVDESGPVGMDRQPQERNLPVGGQGLLDIRQSVHEVAHQLAFNSGLQKRGVMYPLWVSEGLATNFETDSLKAIGLARNNYPRRRQLLAARHAGRLMPLESFVNLVQLPAGTPEAANDLYAEAWALFNFLFNTRRVELCAYLKRLSNLESGPRTPETMYDEFTSTFGSLEAIEPAWLSYIDSLQTGQSR